MSTPPTSLFTQSTLTTLTHLTHLLHLFHHRNKNQHRHSLWYRHFSSFRKQLNTLHASLTTLHSTPETHLARTRKKAQDRALRSSLSARLDFWRDVLVPKWEHAFGQLVADVRFAVLGVVLIAVLAQVCGAVEITGAYEAMAEGEVERVLEEFGREFWGDDGAGGARGRDGGRGGGEDVGEVVRRDEGGDVAQVSTPPAPVVRPAVGGESRDDEQVVPKISTRPPRKKRRKGGDAIDDLFSGLD